MAIGISASSVPSIGTVPSVNMAMVEARVQSNLLQALVGTDQGIDDLDVLRNDQAFELGIPQPLPGSSM